MGIEERFKVTWEEWKELTSEVRIRIGDKMCVMCQHQRWEHMGVIRKSGDDGVWESVITKGCGKAKCGCEKFELDDFSYQVMKMREGEGENE